jgi:succinoglycan biosynthesis transport protein ExoP
MKRIAQSYRNAYDIAVAGEKSLSDQIARQQASDLSASPAAVQLAELQRQADSARAAYQALLDSSNQLAQRQTVPVTEARVIERAQPPDSPASPQTKLVLALAGGLGLVAGLGLVVVRGAMDDRIRSQEMLERTTHRQSLGVVPRLRLPSAGRNGPRLAAAGPRFALPAPGQEAAGAINPVLLQGFRRALADPFSPQVEVMRSINAFLAARQPQRVDPADAAAHAPARVISFASLGPGEGKTTISALFATYLAQNGVKVLLIDADFRRPGLTRLLAPTATAGLFDLPDAGDAVPAERGMLSPGELGVTGFEGRLTLLPGRLRGRPANLLEERLGGLLQRVIGAFRHEVRTIIVDLPPALTLPDAPAVANLFDDIFLVAEWGETDEQTINAAMSHASSFYDRITGTLLNKVRHEALTSYGRSESVRIGYSS